VIDLSKFKSYAPSGRRDELAEVAGISGGRSSAYLLMALINGGFGKSKNHYINFENTGKEHETAYVFLRDLQKESGVKIDWIEYTLTPKFFDELVWSSFSYDKFNRGEYNHIGEILNIKKLQSFKWDKSPNNFWYKEGYWDNLKSIREVDFNTASRNGKPFADVFLYKCAIRIMKGEGILLPSAGQRWCTGDMKEKLLHNWMKGKGHSKYVKYMGMRFDEPKRVDRIFRKNTNEDGIIWDCPLHWLEVIKMDTLQAWVEQPIDLGLIEDKNCFKDVIGNCEYCHLKTLLKKMYLVQQGIDNSFYKQIERLANNYNGDIDCMNRQHGTYEEIEAKALKAEPITTEQILSDEEMQMECVGCGD
jgi:3'-phosphoadenosine 5'-phosphosulfate sulfotransferase (PAPS reductase)/FAD synthetase